MSCEQFSSYLKFNAPLYLLLAVVLEIFLWLRFNDQIVVTAQWLIQLCLNRTLYVALMSALYWVICEKELNIFISS